MKKRAKILLIIIILVALSIGIMYLVSILGKNNLTGNSVLMSENKGEKIDRVFLDNLVSGFIKLANEEEKYLQFIADSNYDSVELIIDKKAYYLEYNPELNQVVETEPKATDFIMKISARKLNKAFELYQEGNFKGAAMKVVGEIPRKVKINLFKQCMETEWCKNGQF